jgi:polysaccharide export outer membrane protein
LTPLPLIAEDKVVAKPQGKPKEVIVSGQVTRPGVLEYREKITIYSVIFAAGGPTEFGTLKRVKVIRGGKTLQFDLTKGKSKNEKFAEPDDVIEVPQMNIKGG